MASDSSDFRFHGIFVFLNRKIDIPIYVIIMVMFIGVLVGVIL